MIEQNEAWRGNIRLKTSSLASRLLTSKNINAGGIDSHYMELQGAFGYLFREETDLTEMLRQMVK